MPDGNGTTWKITLPCTRAEAELAVDADVFGGFDGPAQTPAPTMVTREIEASEPDKWAIDVYCATKPGNALLKIVAYLSPSAKRSGINPEIEKLGDEDWITMSQRGLEPLRAGRFYVHTSNDAPLDNPIIKNIRIDAGQAFGTGHHETTLGCLETLDMLKLRGHHFRNIIDVGTGTGLLAFAAKHLWPAARIIASDIDPVAVEVSQRNANENGIKTGQSRNTLHLVASNGLDHSAIQRRRPYDLIIANILAGPLVSLAPQIAAAAKPGTILILAGLLHRQKNDVVRAYLRAGFRLRHTRNADEWPCLLLVKARHYGRNQNKRRTRSPLASDYFGEC